HPGQCRNQKGAVPRGRTRSRLAVQGASLVRSRRAFSCPDRLSSGQCGMQAGRPAGRRRWLQWRARLLVQGIDAASAAVQTEATADAGQFARGMQADCQSTVMVGLTWPDYLRKVVGSNIKARHELWFDRSTMAIDVVPLRTRKCTLAAFRSCC